MKRHGVVLSCVIAMMMGGVAGCGSGGTPIVETPVLSPGTGTYANAVTVKMSDATPHAKIFYTTDESTPSAASILYTGPIVITSTETINAIGIEDTYNNSAVVTATYTITKPGPVATPQFCPVPGAYPGPLSVTITDATPNAAIYFTTDGSTPSAASTLYTSPIMVAPPETIKAIGVESGYYNSAVATGAYTLAPTTGGPWTWMGGSNTRDSNGNYVQDESCSPDVVPPSRYSAATWTDQSGNLWMFGGGGGNWLYNDLWLFNPTTAQWTFKGGGIGPNPPGNYGTLGVASASNLPTPRYGSATWVDKAGNFWLFGGGGANVNNIYTVLNDLWEFSPSTSEWTWVGGSNAGQTPSSYGTQGIASPSNFPGARLQSISWTDNSGNFWLYGGEGITLAPFPFNDGALGDLWKFDVASREWTWMNGSTLGDPAPMYGTLGIAAATNSPGAREGSAHWTDNNGNLWLFSASAYSPGSLCSDLWKYNPATNEWTWAGGNTLTYQPGTYGTLGVADPGNLPGARSLPASWTDSDGNFMLLGGTGFDSKTNVAVLNDLWKFDTAAMEWTWIDGSNVIAAPGVYGTLYVPASTNVPGARYEHMWWYDGQGSLWMFGGSGVDVNGDGGLLNDIWRYKP